MTAVVNGILDIIDIISPALPGPVHRVATACQRFPGGTHSVAAKSANAPVAAVRRAAVRALDVDGYRQWRN
ncbi:MAG: hypothetical protein ABI394_10955 [Mycobacterium sp.]